MPPKTKIESRTKIGTKAGARGSSRPSGVTVTRTKSGGYRMTARGPNAPDLRDVVPEMLGALSPAASDPVTYPKCPKCGAGSGDDWRQCDGVCPMPMSPHYDPEVRHVAYIEVAHGGTRHAVCLCKWEGPERRTLELAVDDALTHEGSGMEIVQRSASANEPLPPDQLAELVQRIQATGKP